MIEKPSGAHIAERFVVTVRFTVSSDAYKLSVFAIRVKSILNAFSKNIGVAQKMFKSHSARKPRIVKENIQVAVANFFAVFVHGENAIRTSCVDVCIFATFPIGIFAT